jgi:hypothetical protein
MQLFEVPLRNNKGRIPEEIIGEVARVERALRPMALPLPWPWRSEAVELDASRDADDAGLIFAGGEVAGLLRGPWAGTVGPVTDGEVRVEDLE